MARGSHENCFCARYQANCMRVIYGIRWVFPYAAFSLSNSRFSRSRAEQSLEKTQGLPGFEILLAIDLIYTRPEVYLPPKFEPLAILSTGPPFRSSFTFPISFKNVRRVRTPTTRRPHPSRPRAIFPRRWRQAVQQPEPPICDAS